MYGTISFLFHPFETATLLLHVSSDEFKCTAQKFDLVEGFSFLSLINTRIVYQKNFAMSRVFFIFFA